MIDRSQFLEEIRNNPAILNRIAAIVHGEVGNALPEKLMIQAETIFNRAMARGQTLEEVTRTIPEGRGYYPQETLDRGNAYMSNPQTYAQFRDKILRPVIGGSDIGTEKLGFAPTGNASEGKTNFASRRAADPAGRYYSQHKWYGDPKKGGEMYVEEKGRLDRPERITANRKGGPEPAKEPVTDPATPQPAAASAPTESRSMGNLLADHVAGTPWEPTPAQQSALVTGVPSTQSTPAPTATPAPARTQTQSARAPAAAPRAAAPAASKGEPYDYIDPNTGHRIVNPKGSGEQAMGLTRDIGPPPRAAAPARSAAPTASAKPAKPAEEFSPRSAVSDSVRTSPPEQVARPDERSSVAPFDQSAMDPTLLPQQRYIDMGPRLDEGPTPPGAISGAPGAAAVAAMAPPQADFLTTLFQNLSRTPDRPLSTPPATAAPTEPFAPGARNASFPFAPAQRGPLDARPPNDASLLPRGLQDPSAASAFGGTRPLNIAPPRTVDQQLGGLSPFAPSPGGAPGQMAGLDLEARPSPYPKPGTPWPTPKGQQPGPIMPAEPWQPPDWTAAPGTKVAGAYIPGIDPQLDRDFGRGRPIEQDAEGPTGKTEWMNKTLEDFAKAGQPPRLGSNFTPPGAQLYPQASSPNDSSLKLQPNSPMGRAFGLGGVPEPPVRAFDRMRDPMGGYPPAALPRQDQMSMAPAGLGGSATQPTPQQAAMQTLAADPQRDPQSFDTAMQGNLSPFQEWPPPWWGDGYNSFGGGGFDFGGGGDWGGGSYGGEGFAGYGDFGLGSYG